MAQPLLRQPTRIVYQTEETLEEPPPYGYQTRQAVFTQPQPQPLYVRGGGGGGGVTVPSQPLVAYGAPPFPQPQQQQRSGTNWPVILGAALALAALGLYVDQQSWAPWRNNKDRRRDRDKKKRDDDDKKKKDKDKKKEEEREEEEEKERPAPKPTPTPSPPRSTLEPENTPYERVVTSGSGADAVPLDKITDIAYDGDRVVGSDLECGAEFASGQLEALLRRYNEEGKPDYTDAGDPAYWAHAIRETQLVPIGETRPHEWLWCWLRFPRNVTSSTPESVAQSTVSLVVGKSRRDATRTGNPVLLYSIGAGPSAASLANFKLAPPTLEVRDCRLHLEWRDPSGTVRSSLLLGDLRAPPPPSPFENGGWYHCDQDGRVYTIEDGRRRWIDAPPFVKLQPRPNVIRVPNCTALRTIPMGPRIL